MSVADDPLECYARVGFIRKMKIERLSDRNAKFVTELQIKSIEGGSGP